MKLNPYLEFDGDCADAFAFYARVLGEPVPQMMRFGDAPGSENLPPGSADRVMHVTLPVGDQMLMGSDTTPGQPFDGVRGMSVALHPQDAGTAERLFRDLSEGGRVTMPMERTFWAERFGMLVDRFGVPWMINCQGDVRLPGC